MQYKELSKLFYQDESPNRYQRLEEEAALRKNAASSFALGVTAEVGDLFVAMPRELQALLEQILRVERKVSLKLHDLPVVAQRALIRGLVLDEVVSTNAIENVYSTRKQIEQALDSAPKNAAETRRFRELALLYFELYESRHMVPRTPKDIRNIYNQVIEGELSPDKKLDGELFRAEGVQIITEGAKVIHAGLEPEEKIIEALEAMFFLLEREDIPEIVAVAASHYIFEYAHPFYDGNGRTGRYLLSLYLRDVLSTPTVLSLSRVIFENRDKYYRAFKTVSNPLNKGETTFFVYTMLELIRKAQDQIIRKIEFDQDVYKAISENMLSFEGTHNLPERELEILHILTQYYLFGSSCSVGLDELSSMIGLKEQMTRKHLVNLEKADFVSKSSLRPVRFVLSENAKEVLGIVDL